MTKLAPHSPDAAPVALASSTRPASEPMDAISDEQFHDFVAGALHGLDADGVPVKGCTERDEAEFRAALACAGLEVHSTRVSLFDAPVAPSPLPAREPREEGESLTHVGYAEVRASPGAEWRENGMGARAFATRRAAAAIPAHKTMPANEEAALLRRVVPVYAKQSDVRAALSAPEEGR